jgi:hypothetical protein
MAKVSVELFMPLSLQLFCQQAIVWANLLMLLFLRLLLANAVIAAAETRSYLCRSERTRQKSTCLQDKPLKH